MRTSSHRTIVRIHVDMNRGNGKVRDYVESLLSRMRFFQSRLMRSLAHFGASWGIAPRSFALIPIQGRPATAQGQTWPTPENLG